MKMTVFFCFLNIASKRSAAEQIQAGYEGTGTEIACAASNGMMAESADFAKIWAF